MKYLMLQNYVATKVYEIESWYDTKYKKEKESKEIMEIYENSLVIIRTRNCFLWMNL